MPAKPPDPERDAPADETLPEYERPTMPWEREATVGRSGASLVSEFTVTVGIFLALGWWLDGRLGTKPWLLLAGAAVGLTLGIYRLATQGARELEREQKP